MCSLPTTSRTRRGRCTHTPPLPRAKTGRLVSRFVATNGVHYRRGHRAPVGPSPLGGDQRAEQSRRVTIPHDGTHSHQAELFYRWSRHRAHREKCIAAALDRVWAAMSSWKPCPHSLPRLDDRIRPIGRFDLHRSAVTLRDGCPGSCAGSRPGCGLGLPDTLGYAAGERPRTCAHLNSANQPREAIMGRCPLDGVRARTG